MTAATGERASRLDRHPTVISVRARQAAGTAPSAAPATLGFDELRELCLAAGADDVGFVEITRPEVADQKADIDAVFPRARTLVGFVCRMNRENIRTPARSIANLEFHHSTDHSNEVGRRIVAFVRPLQRKEETVYVVAGSDAEEYVPRKFPHKHLKRVGNGIRPQSIAGFVVGMPLAFQRGRSEGLDATYHFTFTGEEEREVTVVVRDRTIRVDEGHVGAADLRVVVDSRTWLAIVAGDVSPVRALLLRRIRLRGSPRLLRAFARCFPS